MFKRTAVYVRGKTRTRRGKTAFGALFAIIFATVFAQILMITPAQAAGVTDCPGGSYSGKGSSSCSNLRNKNTKNQRAFPQFVYRGDSREPYDILRNGFYSRGRNDDLVQHIQGDKAYNSNYISTSGSLSLSETFAKSQGMRNLDTAIRKPGCSTGRMKWYAAIPLVGPYLLSECVDDKVSAYTFVYVIDTHFAKNADYVPDQIRGNKALYNQYKSQDEWAYVRRISPDAIVGVRMYKMTARVTRQGTLDLRTLTFKYDKFYASKMHLDVVTMSNYHPYDPVNDAVAQWNYYSDLHTPNVPTREFSPTCPSLLACRGIVDASEITVTNTVSSSTRRKLFIGAPA